jgi:hypothetical protein
MLKKSVLLFSILIQLMVDINAQKHQVENTIIENVNRKLEVKYDLIKTKPGQLFKITLQITKSNGNMITAKSLTGDIGEKIVGGANKKITWDYIADGILLNDEISIEVFADLINPEYHLGKSLMLSAIWPGLGMSSVESKKPYWLLGVATYGCLGASYYYNKKANDSYNLYLNNTDETLNKELLKKSQDQNKLSKNLAYTAIGIWGVNLIWTAIRIKSKSSKKLSLLTKHDMLFYSQYDPFTRTKGFALRMKF